MNSKVQTLIEHEVVRVDVRANQLLSIIQQVNSHLQMFIVFRRNGTGTSRRSIWVSLEKESIHSTPTCGAVGRGL